MFDQVFENLEKATESSMKMQQEMYQKWVSAFPSAFPSMSTPVEALDEWQKKWAETSADMLKRQKELLDQNFAAGQKSLEEMFSVADAKSPQEYQKKVTELYAKSFDSIRQLSEAQITEFKSAVDQWTEVLSKAS